MKLLYSWIYLYHSPTELHYLWPHIYANELSASGRHCWSGDRGFPGNTVHKTELLSQTLLYQTLCKMKWKWHPNFSKNSRFPSEIQWYKNTRTGFWFWNVQCSTKRSPHPPTIRISVGGIYFYDITNTGKQLCSPNEPFVVVLEKGLKKIYISPFGVDFEICNFVDIFMPKHTHYTLTKFKKWKSIIGPL